MLEEVSIVEKISVSDTDVNREIAAMSSMYHMTPKQVVKALQENGQIQNVLSNIRHQNAMRFLFDNNIVKDENAENAAENDSKDDNAENAVESENKDN